jgi:hypothetical protein
MIRHVLTHFILQTLAILKFVEKGPINRLLYINYYVYIDISSDSYPYFIHANQPLMQKPSENEILYGINAKDPEALQELFEIYYAPLKFFAKKLIGKDLEDEIIVNPFLNLHTENHHFETFESLRIFLYDSVIDICFKCVQQEPDKLNLLVEKRMNKEAERYMIKTEVVRRGALRKEGPRDKTNLKVLR